MFCDFSHYFSSPADLCSSRRTSARIAGEVASETRSVEEDGGGTEECANMNLVPALLPKRFAAV